MGEIMKWYERLLRATLGKLVDTIWEDEQEPIVIGNPYAKHPWGVIEWVCVMLILAFLAMVGWVCLR